MDRRPQLAPEIPTGTTKTELFVLSMVLCALFFMATQSFFHSAKENFGRLESDQAAEQMEEGSIERRISFMALGALGLGCLLAPSSTTFQFHRPLTLIFASFVLWNSASVLWSVTPGISFRRLILMACYLMATVGVTKRIGARGLPWLTLFGAGVLALIGVVAEISLGTFHPLDGAYRFAGTMQPNLQGMNCALIALSAFWMMKVHPRQKRMLAVIGVIALGLMMLTKSRTCVAAVIASGLLAFVLTDRRGRHIAAAGIVVWAVGLVYVLVGDSLVSSASEAATLGRSGGGVTEMSGRMPLWTELMEYVEENPILGYGFGGFWTAEHVAEIAAKEGWVVTSAHSAYMECLLGTGIPGCFFYSALFLGALVASVAQYRRTDRAETGFIACTLLYCMVHGSMEAAMATVPQFATLIVFAAVFVLAFDPASPADRQAGRSSQAASPTGPVQRLVWSA